MNKIAFIDLEASGLAADSWPIEVGWCFARGAPEAYLIAPHEAWPRAAWDPEAEALHGLAMEELDEKGAPAAAVCRRLNAALEGATVFSDAPDWDGFWLYRLFSTAQIRQKFSLADFGDVLVAMAGENLDDLIEKANEQAPRRHRVRDDVLHMRAVYMLARERRQGRLGP